MAIMNERLREYVRKRARCRCEYCHFPENWSELPFHTDHILPRKHGGQTTEENLAWACSYCNGYKGPNLAGFLKTENKIIELYNPRKLFWEDHFAWAGAQIIQRSKIAEATIQVLRLNHQDALASRAELIKEGGFHPKSKFNLGPLKNLAGGAERIEISATNLIAALEILGLRFPGMLERLVDENGQARRFINIYINDPDIRFLKKLDTQLKEGDEISLIPAMAEG